MESTRIEKPWGYEEVVARVEWWQVKRLVLRPGEETSTHYHRQKAEFLCVVRGGGMWWDAGQPHVLAVGRRFMVPPTVRHRLDAADEGLELLESSFGSDDDVVRVHDKHGRIAP